MPTRMDSMMSQGKGKLKGIKARLEGLVGVFKTLAEQHGEVSALMERVKSDPAKRSDLWPRIRRELVSHERGEVREVYPLLRAIGVTRELADRHDREAKELEAVIERLEIMPIDTDAWGELFDQLFDTVINHAAEEEDDLFPRAQEALGDTIAKELDAKFLRTKHQVADSI